MAVTHSDGMANNTLDNGFKGAFNTTGVIKIYSGSAPGANNAVTGTLLSTLTFAATAFGAASGRVSTAAAIAGDTSAAATGTAGYFRCKLSGDADTATASLKRLEGTVTATGGGGDLQLNNVNIAASGAVNITSFTYTHPT
jgi:hypothetical protein